MQEHDFDDIENLGRKAAEHFDGELFAPSWDILEKKLDEELPQKKKKRRFIFFWFLLAGGGLSGAAYLAYHSYNTHATNISVLTIARKNNSSSENITVGNKVVTNTKTNNYQPTAILNKGNEIGTIINTTTKKQIIVENNKEKVVRKASRKINVYENNQVNTVQESYFIENKNTAISNNRNFIDITNHYKIEKKNIVHISKDTIAISPDEQLIPNNTILKVDPDHNNLAKNSLLDTTIKKRAKTDTALTTKNKKSSKFLNYLKPLTIAASFEADESTIRFDHFDNLGFAVGVMLGYPLSSHWSLHSGIFISRKNYIASGSEYKFNPNILTLPSYNKINLNQVNGYFYTSEIPLNVRYSFAITNKTILYVSTGISLYMMDTENDEYNLVLDDTLHINTRKNYQAGEDDDDLYELVGNFSAGIHSTINNKWAWEFEPFTKVPITKIGVGNIQLLTFGAYFSLCYKPFVNVKKNK